ncbi:phage tail tape measure protein [Geomicrobium sp. JCM 19055]|uniref:phage tail tape measure protein n=1 Tax=Geomicrobium sp. JCM 19055 TaxID=1460649 RepID=UPI00045ECFEA|nr:phage tail tape measure protein [Geomicrobium sp. JCM 19055]GAK00906.1 phage tail length tape-measure protein [Geomicrobium sp. JCM 19055]
MATLSEIMVRIGTDTANFRAGMSEVENSLNRTSKQFTSIGKSLMTKVSLPLTAIGVGAIKVGADFEKSMSNVQAVTGATASEMDNMGDTARSLARDSMFTAGEVGDAMGYLGMAGFETNEILDATGICLT